MIPAHMLLPCDPSLMTARTCNASGATVEKTFQVKQNVPGSFPKSKILTLYQMYKFCALLGSMRGFGYGRLERRSEQTKLQ